MMRQMILACLGLAVAVCGCVAAPAVDDRPATKESYAALAAEIEAAFERDVLGAWLPRAVDPAGGFHAGWDRTWTKKPVSGKHIVFQSRMTWLAAQAAIRRPDKREQYLAHARHGFKFLDEKMWDKQYGGFFFTIDDRGEPVGSAEKHVYGVAFGMYAAAAVYEASGDQAALDLAIRTFNWLERHAHDAKNGGYHEVLARSGQPILPDHPLPPGKAQFPGGHFFYGYKSMNAHIHLLEALSSLSKAWKNDLAKERTAEVLAIVRDRIAVEPGCLNLFFTPDWRAVPEHDSFGHDIETGFLLLEAAEEGLGQHPDEKTERMARMLVDHALDWGWDEANGGFYDKGYAFGKAHDTTKVWWTEVEGLNVLLLMHERHGQTTDRYWKAFLKQWGFIKRSMIDADYPGLYESTQADGTPTRRDKGHHWKAGYHDGRSFMLTAERLRKMGKE